MTGACREEVVVRVLVASRPSSPRRDTDVWSAMRGEIVVAPFVCPDRGCECDRVRQGIVSHGYSTEAEVRDVGASREAVVAACRVHLEASQWAAVVDHPSELDMLAADLVDDMSRVAEDHPAGTVLRMRFDHHAGQWLYAPRQRRN